MGDRSPKSTHKQAAQKQAKQAAEQQKKVTDAAARVAPPMPPKK